MCSWSHGSSSSPGPFSCPFIFSSSLALLSLFPPWPGLFCWPCSVWTLPDASDCFLPRIYNKTFPSAIHTVEWSCPHFHSQARIERISLKRNQRYLALLFVTKALTNLSLSAPCFSVNFINLLAKKAIGCFLQMVSFYLWLLRKSFSSSASTLQPSCWPPSTFLSFFEWKKKKK